MGSLPRHPRRRRATLGRVSRSVEERRTYGRSGVRRLSEDQTVYVARMVTNMTLRETILDEIRRVAENQRKTLLPLTDDLSLNDSGLDSLCFAILVARLEDITGRDPLGAADGARFPRTIGEFVALYEEAVA